MVNLILKNLLEYNTLGGQLLNAYKRVNNLQAYLDKELEKLQRERTYKLKFPLNLIFRKTIFDDVSDPEEIESYNETIAVYNEELKHAKDLANERKRLKHKLKTMIAVLDFEELEQAFLEGGSTKEKAKETYAALKQI